MGNQCGGRTRNLKPYNSMLEPYSERTSYRTMDIEVPDITQFWRNVLARADLPGICPSQLERIGKIIYEKSSRSAYSHISMAEFIKMCAINHLIWFSDSELERFVSSTCLEFFQSDIQDKYAKESLMEITSLLAKCVPRSPRVPENDAVMVPVESPSERSMSLFSCRSIFSSSVLPTSSPGSVEGQSVDHFAFPKLEADAGAYDHDWLSVGSSVWSIGNNSEVECLQEESKPIKPDMVLRTRYTTFSLKDIPCSASKGGVRENKNDCLRTALI